MLAMPALVMAYGRRVGFGLSEFTEEVPMIDDPGRMCGRAAFVRWNIALRLTAIV